MRMRLVLLFSLVLRQTVWAQPLVIKRVTVIDATGKPGQPNMTVVIAAGRIVAVSPWKKAKVPKNAQVLDGTGKFLIPGLWDMHTHGIRGNQAAQDYSLYLANGVLGVRYMLGPPNAREWRARQAALSKPAPSVFLASPVFDGPKPVWPDSITVADETQARQAVAQQKELGADFIKVYSLLPRDAYFAIADEARKRSISFVGHVPQSVKVVEASDAGQKSIEHLDGLALGCSAQEEALSAEAQRITSMWPAMAFAGRAFETYDEVKAQYLFARLVKNGTWQCPTLTLLRSVSRREDPQLSNDDRLKYIAKDTRSFWENSRNNPQLKGLTEKERAALQLMFSKSMRLVGDMHRAGVSMLAGTDYPNPYCFPGFGLHDELALLVESGMSPMAALQAATTNAARFMGQLDRRGTIEIGKIADLVLLDRNPLADIHNTRAIQAIVLNGKLMTRAALDAMLSESEALAAK
jgi:hypothetical protein